MPRRRLKLWHLAVLVASSAMIFGAARAWATLAEARSVVGGLLCFGPLLSLFMLVIDRSVKLGDRIARAIEGRGDGRGRVWRYAAGWLAAWTRGAFFVSGIGLVVGGLYSLILMLAWAFMR